ncbi:MAG: phosphoribosylformylglycinamidine synthase [Clostridia bacterium]|nr:phosphoribosylformylglycinamidine synthase [Clostridia bacterium]
MVYRVYVEKREELANEAKSLKNDIVSLLQIKGLKGLRLLNRYDVENIEKELYDYAVKTVFSEPQLDIVTEELENTEGGIVFATEYLPGQFDQRADSAAQCIQIISQGERPLVKTARVYVLYGELDEADVEAIKKYVINPVESREASLDKADTLVSVYDIPTEVATLDGFLELDEQGLADFVKNYGLAMDNDDIKFCQDYFKTEDRDPTITEIRMIDTYWSDHCRHTTFLTTIDEAEFEDETIQAAYNEYLAVREKIGRTKPVNLMDIGTLAAKYLNKEGKLPHLDESEEINACTVKIKVNVEGEMQDWLLLFKNETHNHPTEIEPFGGAATCIGGAIRDPLSGRSYVYAAMRVTGAADPTKPVSETMAGKLPQRKIVTTAAAGYSSYGNQIGLATGQVDEIYHDGYVAKRMEIGAVIAAAPAENVRRERPEDGDIVILLGGRTGRDGCGGATGSSKSHTLESLESCGAEVQKGNAPEERKLQRLFRNKEASLLIKRCNDFGAGGVSVAVGELADGLVIDLNAVPKKYDGLDGTELAISESQERMAVVVEPGDVERFKELAEKENLEATVVARVQAEPRLVMNWNGKAIVDISREFLNSNGAEKHIKVKASKPEAFDKEIGEDFIEEYMKLASDLNVCSKRGLSERFDSTIGAGTVLMPFGGKYQQTPIQAMVNKVSVEKAHTDTVSLMAWGYNPYIAEKSPYHSAYLAVVESVSKLVAAGAKFEDVYLTFQEYFERPRKEEKRWGKPFSALLGAFKAQLDYGIAAIGGKDSMSGSFEDIDVPPTLVSFAVTTDDVKNIVSPEFKAADHKVVIIKPDYEKNGLPVTESQLEVYKTVNELIVSKKAVAAYTPTYGGVAEAVMKMTFGNRVGFAFADDVPMSEIFGYNYGAFILELAEDIEVGEYLGVTIKENAVFYKDSCIKSEDLQKIYEDKLEKVYPANIKQGSGEEIPAFSYTAESRVAPAIKVAKPRVLIPVFPGTNCEFDTAKVMRDAGAEPEIFVINNLTSKGIAESVTAFADKVKESQIIFIPGGFSGGDEPDGSGKFITAFFRAGAVKEQVNELLRNRDGLMCGICNGFQAIIKLGLVPYGEIIDTDASCPTLTFNTIGRHQSRMVQTRIASNKSPWLAETNVGDIYNVPISHGEGKFLCDMELVKKLAENGQIATQYVDLDGKPTSDILFNPNDSVCAIEGITSPDGRVFGKMGHSERTGSGLYKNVDGNYDMKMFKSAVRYFK